MEIFQQKRMSNHTGGTYFLAVGSTYAFKNTQIYLSSGFRHSCYGV